MQTSDIGTILIQVIEACLIHTPRGYLIHCEQQNTSRTILVVFLLFTALIQVGNLIFLGRTFNYRIVWLIVFIYYRNRRFNRSMVE